MSEEIQLYKTSDLYFSAYLCSSGVELHSHEAIEGFKQKKKVIFMFDLTEEELKEHKVGYFNRKGKVIAKDYVESFRELKEKCFKRIND